MAPVAPSAPVVPVIMGLAMRLGTLMIAAVRDESRFEEGRTVLAGMRGRRASASASPILSAPPVDGWTPSKDHALPVARHWPSDPASSAW